MLREISCDPVFRATSPFISFIRTNNTHQTDNVIMLMLMMMMMMMLIMIMQHPSDR